MSRRRRPFAAALLATAALLLAGCAAGPAPLPPAVDLRPQLLAFGLPPMAQGQRPTCSIFVVTAAYEFALARAAGRGERLSAEYVNWAANAANDRHDDGDFFHFALSGVARFGICPATAMPYAAAFPGDAMPPADALVAGGAFRGGPGARLRVRWLRPIDGKRGLDGPQFAAVQQALADGLPVAAGSGHSRLLVGYRLDAAAPGGGVFLAVDSARAAFTEVDFAWARADICDAFVVEPGD